MTPPEEILLENDWHLLNMAKQSDIIIIACGNVVDIGLYERMLDVLKPFKLHHLGLNKSGIPKHPLYLRADTPLQTFREAA